MKTLLLLTIAFMQLAVAGHGQEVSLHVKNASIEQVLYQLSQESGYDFIYDARLLRKVPRVTMRVSNAPFKEVLEQCFADQSLEFIFNEDKTVVIKQKSRSHAIAPAQETFTGTVRDSLGNPLEGVSVLVRGTSRGTATNATGQFQIQADVSEVLVFSALGFMAQEITLTGQRNLSVVLVPESADLDEVVVIGYGTTTRKDLTGAVSSLKLEDSPVALMPNLNVLEALKGSIPGLNIGATNRAGGEPDMQVRGQNSVHGDNNPLIVLDGVIFLGSISDINPNDIASIDVLKDATSAAAYGSRSANGVIAITTKKGRFGKPLIAFNTSTGFQRWQNQPVMMKGQEWVEAVNARNQYTEGSTNWLKPGELANMEAGRETVWLDEVSRTGVMQNYQAAVSGSSEWINYYVSTSYDDNKSVMVGEDFDRISLLGKLNTQVTDWLEVGLDAGYSRRDYSGNAANVQAAQRMSPYGVMFRDEAGNLEKYPYTQSLANPLWGVDDGLRDNLDLRNSLRLNAHALVRIPWVAGLSYRANYMTNIDRYESGVFIYEGYYVQEGEGLERYDPAVVQGFLTNSNGYISNERARSYVIDHILNYKQTFEKHSMDVTLVATRDYVDTARVITRGSDFAANGNTILGMQGLDKATVQRIELDGRKRTNVGYLGRVSYAFDDKYYFTGSYRRDGASVFGVNNKWADFAAAGVAWAISNEPFMQNLKPLDYLKLKFSFGQNGNQGIAPYGTLSTVANASSGGVRYEFSDGPGIIRYGLYQNTLGDADLGWEKTESWNAGFESAWLDNRLFVDLDAYFSKTTDQIFRRNIPVMTGFKTVVTSMGQVNNTGIDLTVRSVNVRNANWNWNTAATFWKNNNKLVKLYGEDHDGDGREDDDIGNELFIGHSLEAIYGYVQDGIVQESDTEYMELTGAAAGAPKYRDIDGVPGITEADRQVLGYRMENFRLSLSNSVTYKNLDLYVMLTGTFGGNNRFLQSNTTAYLTGGTGRFNDNMTSKPYWTPENPSNEYPSAYFAGDGRYLALQSRGFVRIQDVTLSYTFRQPWMGRAKLQALKLFATAKNLGTFTDWYGGDPETGATIISDTFPVLSTYAIGLNASF
ncbi:SusC/RagA family TonB-linked outer membrane protein [Parapedobacter tibetensis]|uniref:SusC/RagA family TonB-linked outer membrane protein n=1 Tax=Parapedobacter tibetensis TaxID=2972951 RepID=UPI00214D8FE8|nr:SusC/RagA family TonB-linked outer membrane protein [Parapedobacter tibetensis]